MESPLTQLRQSIDNDLRSFANYLYLTKSTLQRVEKGILKLPEKPKKLISALEEQLKRKKTVRDLRLEFEKSEKQNLASLIKNNQKDVMVKILPLENRLQKMEAEYQLRLEILERLSLLEFSGTDQVSRRHKRWLESAISLQQEKLTRVGLVNQYKLRAKIEGLKLRA